jgi:hypothetical protein
MGPLGLLHLSRIKVLDHKQPGFKEHLFQQWNPAEIFEQFLWLLLLLLLLRQLAQPERLIAQLVKPLFLQVLHQLKFRMALFQPLLRLHMDQGLVLTRVVSVLVLRESLEESL